MHFSKSGVIRFCWIALICTLLCEQSVWSEYHPKTFHVEGTVRTFFMSSAIAGIKVEFKNENTSKAVFSDNAGFYSADLPVGTYKMTASWGGREKYQRPIFRVASPRDIFLDIALYPDDPDCDTVVSTIVHSDGTVKTSEMTDDDYKDACGGRDYWPIPSKDRIPFDLFVRYGHRHRSASGNTYNSDPRGPVFVAFNLFTLAADSVVYNTRDQTIQASGNIIVADGSGKTQHADAAEFKLEDGQATPLK